MYLDESVSIDVFEKNFANRQGEIVELTLTSGEFVFIFDPRYVDVHLVKKGAEKYLHNGSNFSISSFKIETDEDFYNYLVEQKGVRISILGANKLYEQPSTKDTIEKVSSSDPWVPQKGKIVLENGKKGLSLNFTFDEGNNFVGGHELWIFIDIDKSFEDVKWGGLLTNLPSARIVENFEHNSNRIILSANVHSLKKNKEYFVKIPFKTYEVDYVSINFAVMWGEICMMDGSYCAYKGQRNNFRFEISRYKNKLPIQAKWNL